MPRSHDKPEPTFHIRSGALEVYATQETLYGNRDSFGTDPARRPAGSREANCPAKPPEKKQDIKKKTKKKPGFDL